MNEQISAQSGNQVAQSSKSASTRKQLRDAGPDLMKVALTFVPGLGGATIEALNVFEARAQRRQAQLVFEVIDRLDTDLAQLERLLSDDGELADLWVRGMQAARTTQADRKIEAFAAILSAFARRDEPRKPASTLAGVMLRVLDSLEEEHIEVLAGIERFEAERSSLSPKGKAESTGVSPDELERRSNYPATVIAIVLDSLLALQLVRDTYEGTWDGLEGAGAYALTDLGSNLLAMLRTPQGHGAEPSDQPVS